MDRFKFVKNNEFNDLPKTSGVYCFLDKKETIYIGKAINMQNRVKNHFSQPSYRDGLFINKVDKIGYLETNSEIEALILEANLIKKYQPKFNVVWRDDKNYFFVAIAGKIPYVYITHQPKSISNSQYIGPFVEGNALKKTLRFLRHAFPYYTSKKHPKIKCTWCHLGLCPGPNPDLKLYKKNVRKLILILKGKRNAVLNSLKEEMTVFSKQNKFEEAGMIRDRIVNLQQVMSHANVIQTGGTSDIPQTNRIECYDISNIQGKQATGSMIVFTDGIPDKSEYKKFKIKMKNEPNDIAMLKEILERRFNHPEWKYPDIILIDGGKAQLNVGINSKSEARNPKQIKNIRIISVAKGKQELFVEGRNKPIPLKSLPQEVYNLIKRLDDEAHRFAITYHKTLRKKSLLQ